MGLLVPSFIRMKDRDSANDPLVVLHLRCRAAETARIGVDERIAKDWYYKNQSPAGGPHTLPAINELPPHPNLL
jgi:hypothetical protein